MSDESYNSLFDEPYSSDEELSQKVTRSHEISPTSCPQRGVIAVCHAPHIPGLHFYSQLKITEAVESYLLESLEQRGYFARPSVNQVMLFGRPRVSNSESQISESQEQQSNMPKGSSGLPDFLELLVEELKQTLSSPIIPSYVQQKIFDPEPGQARQAILNRYYPGEGIKPHIDLPNRFADGIIIVSLGSGIVMDFAHEAKKQAFSAWLPPRSIVVLEGEARWEWTHGIAYRKSDVVDIIEVGGDIILGAGQSMQVLPGLQNVVEIPRQLRTSITLRWLLAGANVVGV